jgi:hypothetical protein
MHEDQDGPISKVNWMGGGKDVRWCPCAMVESQASFLKECKWGCSSAFGSFRSRGW